MEKFSSFFVKVFSRKINAIFAFGIICFLGIGLASSIIFSGIQTVRADVNMMPIINPIPSPAEPVIPEKIIIVSLKDQTLIYAEGSKIVGEFKISSGLPGTPTPPGEYTVLKKKPVVNYTGPTYSFPNTKWNLMFKQGARLNFYIHGAYWHHNFGHPMSHGCINVAYADMEGLYNWADEGTKIIIQSGPLDLTGIASRVAIQQADVGGLTNGEVAGATIAYVHPSGSVVISQGTIYRISDNGQALEGFDTPEKYFSYRYSFAQAVAATSNDLALPRTVIAWGDGRLFVDSGVGYQVSGGTKHGFVSQDAFLGQGFRFNQAQVGSLNLSAGQNIESASQAHLAGSFVKDDTGTVWYMTATERRGVPSVAHFQSWGVSFNEVVPANANDLAKPAGALLPFRSGSLINDQGSIWVIEGNGKKVFPTAACFTNFGFSFQNVLQASTLGYQDNGTICGPVPAVSYERRAVATSRGSFIVDILTADASQVRVVTDTANDNDCINNCPVKSLLDFVNQNQGFAGIHGSYFCPDSYPDCAGKTNSFYWKVYNSRLGKMINPSNGIKQDKPFAAFDASGTVHFYNQYQDFISANPPIAAGISNEPLLVQNSQIVVTDSILDDKERTVKSNRGGLGVTGQTVYAVVARSATVMDLASIMQAIGAANAFNLDGGGSAAMVYNGAYKAGPGRLIPNALVFVKK